MRSSSSKRPRNAGEALLCARAFLFASVVPLLLRLNLSRLETILEPRRGQRDGELARVERTAELVDAVLSRGGRFVRPGCLTRGVTLFYFLRRAGADVSLCFGVGEPNGEFEGHCWLVEGGEPFLEKTDPRPTFTEIVSIPRQVASGSI